MSPDKKLDYFSINCEKYGQEGYILIDDFEGSYYVVCKKCGGETAEVWCDDCKTGGNYIRHVERHPETWTCGSCSTEHTVPDGFYEKPTYILSKEELPLSIQQKIELDMERQSKERPKTYIYIAVSLFIFYIIRFPPRFLINWFMEIFHQDYDTVRQGWNTTFLITIFSLLILLFLYMQWRSNKKMLLYWFSAVIVIVGSIWFFFLIDDIVSFFQLPVSLTPIFLSIWTVVCCAQMFLLPEVFKKWRLAIDPEYAEQQKKKGKG